MSVIDGSKPRWTDKETEYLRANWGKKTYAEIGKALGKDVKSVQNRATYIGLSATFNAEGNLTLNEVCNALYGYNPNKQVEDKLVEKGFPVERKIFGTKLYRLVDPEAMWKWLKAHKDEFDFVRFKEYSLGAEPKWVHEKRKSDWAKYNKKRWGLA